MNYVRRHPVNEHKNTNSILVAYWIRIGFAPPIKQQSTAHWLNTHTHPYLLHSYHLALVQ